MDCRRLHEPVAWKSTENKRIKTTKAVDEPEDAINSPVIHENSPNIATEHCSL